MCARMRSVCARAWMRARVRACMRLAAEGGSDPSPAVQLERIAAPSAKQPGVSSGQRLVTSGCG